MQSIAPFYVLKNIEHHHVPITFESRRTAAYCALPEAQLVRQAPVIPGIFAVKSVITVPS